MLKHVMQHYITDCITFTCSLIMTIIHLVVVIPVRRTLGRSICKTLNISSANEIAHEEFGRRPVM